MTGSEYITLLKQSEHIAHKNLMDTYISYVYTIVYNKLSDILSKEDIEECVSDIFASIFFDLDCDCKYSEDLKGYIRTVAVNKAIDRYRRLSRKNFGTVPIEEALPSKQNIEQSAENAELQEILMKKIEELGYPDSVIIIQKYYYNRTSRQIAAALSMKPSAVRMRCGRALKKLKKILSELEIF